MLFNNNDEALIKRFLKKEERHKRNAISFYELFLLCRERYIFIENELSELKNILNKNLNIINIFFKENLECEIALIIEFYDDKKEYMVLTSDSEDNLEIVLDTSGGKYNNIIQKNKYIIIDTFSRENQLSISKTFTLSSATNLFDIKGLSNQVSLSLKTKDFENYFKLNYLFNLDRINDKELLKYFECKTNLLELQQELSDLVKLKCFIENIKINEEDVPMVLVKR